MKATVGKKADGLERTTDKHGPGVANQSDERLKKCAL